MTQQTNVKLKLLIDSETRSVLYGEADKDFIDFLFNLLSLPLGAVIRLLEKEQMVGCLGNLYESVDTLSEAFFQPSQSKDTLLKPEVSFNCSTKLLPYTIEASSSTSSNISSSFSMFGKFPSSETTSSQSFNDSYNSLPFGAPSKSSQSNLYNTSSFGSFGRNVEPPPFASTSSQSRLYNTPSSFFPSTFKFASKDDTSPFGFFSPSPNVKPHLSASSSASASTSTSQASTGRANVGFVTNLATYIVMDDLTVKHISDFSITTLFKKFNIKDVDSLEEKFITLNVDEGVEILKASLQSKMVLTDVFRRKEREVIDNNNDLFLRTERDN